MANKHLNHIKDIREKRVYLFEAVLDTANDGKPSSKDGIIAIDKHVTEYAENALGWYDLTTEDISTVANEVYQALIRLRDGEFIGTNDRDKINARLRGE